MTVEELIELLTPLPQYYEVLIWNAHHDDWDDNLTGKLIARDTIGIVLPDEEDDEEEGEKEKQENQEENPS